MIHRQDSKTHWPLRRAVQLLAVIAGLIMAQIPAHARTLLIEGLSEPPLKWLSGKNPRGIDVDIMR